ncbi:MAG: pyridoxal-phosphate dependent enzyme [Thermoplasmataceae archaeon]
MQPIIECSNCKKPRSKLEHVCHSCGHNFYLRVDWKYHDTMKENFPYIDKWVMDPEFRTPILKFQNLWMKLDYFTPSLSYKDRGMVSLFSHIVSDNLLPEGSVVNEDSSGNAGASFSLFSKMCKFKPRIFVSSNSNRIKLDQIYSYGADIIKINGTREDLYRQALAAEGTYLGHAYMPEFIDGIRSLAYELFKQNEKMPERIFIPVSAGTLLLGLISGLEHLKTSGEINEIPEIIAVQPESMSPIYDMLNGIKGRAYSRSIADALVTVNSPHLGEIVSKLTSYGKAVTVSEHEIIESRQSLMELGIYAEYSSATTFAAYKKMGKDKTSLLILTGSGIKNLGE